MTEKKLRAKLKKHLLLIAKMDLTELRQFDEDLQMSKVLMDEEFYTQLNAMVVAHLGYLMEMTQTSVSQMMAETSELRTGEV